MDGLPEWVKNTFPGTLLEALYDFIRKPITKGMKEALDNDNINDVIYFGRQKNGKQFIAKVKGTNHTPIQYARFNKKCRCLIYLFLKNYDGYLFNPYEDGQTENDSPIWYQYFYLYIKGPRYVDPNYMYILFMESKRPFECLDFILEGKQDLSGGSKKPIAYDEKFYKSLSSSDKNKVLNLIVQKKINLQIQNYILLNEPDLLKIAYIVGFYYLADYCLKKDKIDEFKYFVDKHNNEFSGLKQCHIIMPQFSELYHYAYAKHQYSYLDEKNNQYKYIREHAMQLCVHGYHKEFKFMKDKGFYFNNDADYGIILKKQNPKIIELFSSYEIECGMNYLLLKNDENLDNLFRKGYEVSFTGIVGCIKKKNHPLVNTLEIFDHIPKEDKIDTYKFYMLQHQIGLVRSFIRRYKDQFQDDSPDSWEIKDLSPNKKIRQACDILGLDPDDYIDQSESDDDNDDDERPAKKETKSKQQNTSVDYYCKYCGAKRTSFSGLEGGYCKRSPTKSHVPFKDDKRSNYYCQLCGYSNSNVRTLLSSSCSRSKYRYHVLFMNPNSDHLSCMYCGVGGSSIRGLVSGSCKKSPTGHHVPYDGKKK